MNGPTRCPAKKPLSSPARVGSSPRTRAGPHNLFQSSIPSNSTCAGFCVQLLLSSSVGRCDTTIRGAFDSSPGELPLCRHFYVRTAVFAATRDEQCLGWR